MKLNEAIQILNSKKMTVQELAKKFEISKDLLADILKDHGYEFNNKTKFREYVGEGEPVDIDLDLVIVERKSLKGAKNKKQKSIKNDEKFEEKSDKSMTKVEQEELYLTKEEIEFVKKLAKGRDEWRKNFELNYEYSKLPSRKPSKKVPYEISLETFYKFEEFCEQVGQSRRMSRNDLVEMALQKFMRDY